jgi:hypothetical protein
VNKWIKVTAHPTVEWIARQITEAFPWNEAPRYLIRDRDWIYGVAVTRRGTAVYAGHVLGHGRLSDRKAELEQLANECAVHPKAYSQCSFVGSAPVDPHRSVAGLPGSGISSANSGASPHDAIALASRAGWSSLPSRSMETTDTIAGRTGDRCS